MKIWIDLTNSPHVNFFAKMIRDLRVSHDVILTCRPLANTIDLLDIEGFDYAVVGSHYGASKIKKAFGFPVRVYQLFNFLRKHRIDVSISHSSFYSPVVSRLLKAPCIYMNDNEHAKGNKLAFAFADNVLVPESLSLKKIVPEGSALGKFIQYPGVKEGVYLWYFNPQKREGSPLELMGLDSNRKTIFIRPEPWTAQYYQGEVAFMDKLIFDLANDFNVVILPRGEDQAIHYRSEKFAESFVLRGSVRLDDIVARCDLFIGAGGTMTRETAVLGIPTISIYQDELLDVDRFLIQQGCMVHNLNPDVEFVCDFLNTHGRVTANHVLLEKGKLAYNMIIDLMTELGKTKIVK